MLVPRTASHHHTITPSHHHPFTRSPSPRPPAADAAPERAQLAKDRLVLAVQGTQLVQRLAHQALLGVELLDHGARAAVHERLAVGGVGAAALLGQPARLLL